MEYKKIVNQNYNIHIINTERFKTISLSIAFSNKFNESDIPYLNLLIKNLTTSTKKHRTTSSLAILGEELYGSSISASFNIIGSIERIMISLDFLNPKYTEKRMIKESINFLNECLFNPNVDNGKFDKHHFDINKQSVINNLKSIKDNAYSYAFIKFKNEMYKGASMSYSLYNNISKIEKITSGDLYKFYLNVINNFKIDVFLVGNIESEEEYIKYLNKLFSKCSAFKNKLRMGNELLKNKKSSIKEKRKFNQSQLFIGYTFKNLTEYEKNYVLSYYNGILGGISNSLLFSEIRENNSLCYSIDSFTTKDPCTLIISTEIAKENFNKVINLIDKVVNKMGSRKYVLPLFNTTKEYINISLNNYYDNIGIMIDHHYKNEFEKMDDIETKRDKYEKVTVEDILELSKKITKNTTYFLEGDINEKDSI